MGTKLSYVAMQLVDKNDTVDSIPPQLCYDCSHLPIHRASCPPRRCTCRVWETGTGDVQLRSEAASTCTAPVRKCGGHTSPVSGSHTSTSHARTCTGTPTHPPSLCSHTWSGSSVSGLAYVVRTMVLVGGRQWKRNSLSSYVLGM